MELKKSVERIVPKNFETKEEYLLYLRHLFAYKYLITQLCETDRVLEIGFGEGYGTRLISESTKHVVGLDTNRQAVNYANYHYRDSTCIFEHYEGGALPYNSNTFDAVVALQVIEHIKNDEKFTTELHRVVKNGGKAFLTTPNRRIRLSPGEDPWNEFHIREYSPSDFQSLLDGIFRKVELYGIKGKDEVQSIEINRVDKRLTFYKLLPNRIKKWISRDFQQKYDSSSFYFSQWNLAQSIDLFAKAVK